MTDTQQFVLRIQTYCREQKQKYGEPGTPIAGSAYFRGYCCICGSAIRVCEDAKGVGMCGCTNHPIGGIPGPPEDESPWGSNAVRALEGE